MDDLEERIENLFDTLKIEKKLKGYTYLKIAVKYRYLDINYKGSLYSHLYKTIAYDFNTSVAAVERNIRTVLYVSWTKNYSPYQYKLYDNILLNHRDIPTATRFIEQTVILLMKDCTLSL